MMNLKETWPISCPNCGAVIKLSKDQVDAVCQYCQHEESLAGWLQNVSAAEPVSIRPKPTRGQMILLESRINQLEAKLGRIDQRWQLQKEKRFNLHPKANRFPPSYFFVLLLSMLGFACFLTGLVASNLAALFASLVLFLAALVQYVRANAYDTAWRTYKKSKKETQEQLNAMKNEYQTKLNR